MKWSSDTALGHCGIDIFTQPPGECYIYRSPFVLLIAVTKDL